MDSLAHWSDNREGERSVLNPYTPGPWTSGDAGSQVFDIVGPDITGRGKELVGSFRAFQDRKTNSSNAILISSAPDLLAALERLAHPMADDEDLDYAREVIAKAKGQR